ncbi:hypothetical protein MXB_2139, partial [Myxobolus squamalis]
QFEVQSIQITGCSGDSCSLKRHVKHRIVLDFISTIFTPKVWVILMVFPYNLRPITEILNFFACTKIKQGCPLYAKRHYRFRTSFKIPGRLETV